MPNNSDILPIAQVQGKHRRSIRLKGYDYAQAGAYFVTIVSCERDCLFGDIEGNAIKLSEWGEIARDEWFKTEALRKLITLHADEFVVMPNHVHGIIWINNIERDEVGAERRSAPTDVMPHVKAGSLGVVVRGYKSAVTYAVNAARATRGAPLWQRNYYEHIIRDDADLHRIREYIANNPEKWGEDAFHG